MPRRVHAPNLHTGKLTLQPPQAHHVRDVLRLGPGDPLDLFDDVGTTATGRLLEVTPAGVTIDVLAVTAASAPRQSLCIAAAVPKGQRADWMVEKLAELGVARSVPLVADRSVTLPKRAGKSDRWRRLAIEAARQSNRNDVMQIDDLTTLADFADHVAHERAWLLSTEPGASPAAALLHDAPAPNWLLIGPEGGWTDDELRLLDRPTIARVRLTLNILRIETAAVAAAALVICHGPLP
jgi:16S rRNA (uracil1498-N3)-methyltransferase